MNKLHVMCCMIFFGSAHGMEKLCQKIDLQSNVQNPQVLRGVDNRIQSPYEINILIRKLGITLDYFKFTNVVVECDDDTRVSDCLLHTKQNYGDTIHTSGDTYWMLDDTYYVGYYTCIPKAMPMKKTNAIHFIQEPINPATKICTLIKNGYSTALIPNSFIEEKRLPKQQVGMPNYPIIPYLMQSYSNTYFINILDAPLIQHRYFPCRIWFVRQRGHGDEKNMYLYELGFSNLNISVGTIKFNLMVDKKLNLDEKLYLLPDVSQDTLLKELSDGVLLKEIKCCKLPLLYSIEEKLP